MITSFCRRTVLILLAAVAVCPLYSQPPAASAGSASNSTSPANKGQLLSFISYNTVESKMMHDQLAGDAGVKALLEKQFTVTIFVEGRDVAQIQHYQVKSFPAIIATSADGTEIDRIVGFVRPQETMALLENAARGESALSALSAKIATAGASIEDRLEFADAAIRRGKYTDVLRELTVCLDRSSAPAAKDDRRYLKIVLAKLAALGNREPAALELLQTRRDALEKTLSPHFPEPMMVVFAFNEALKQPDKNVDLYLRLPVESTLRDRLFPLVFSRLVEQRRYLEAVDGADLESLVNSAYPKKRAKVDADTTSAAAHSEERNRQRITAITATATEALLGRGQLEKAKRIAGRALETFADPQLKRRLQEAAHRAASPASAQFASWLEQTQSQHGLHKL